MKGGSIRIRLAAWYLGVLAIAIATLAIGSWWLLRRSVTEAADASLVARVAGVRALIESMERELSPAEIVDEFHEYGQLTLGETFLEVTDTAGTVLVRPAMSGWDALRIGEAPSTGTPAIVFAHKTSDGRPFRVAAARVNVRDRTYLISTAISMKPAADALARVRWLGSLLLPALLIFATAGGYWISGRALAPVDRMTRDVQAITLRSLDRRLEVPAADDELRRLAVTFNHMLARLHASVADIVRFTAEASHELRTPVSLVRATAEVALGRDRPADDYRQALAEVLEHAERMSSLVDDLLALARADAGVEPREETVVDLRQVAREAARDLQAAIARKSLRFTLDLPSAPVEVQGHAESLRRLVLILLDNAVKYTPPAGEIGLSVAKAPDAGTKGGAVVTIADNGVGVDAAELPHVFGRFYRGAAARQHAVDGSGLGLSIARTIAERHGGHIDLTSGRGGRGCRASVWLRGA